MKQIAPVAALIAVLAYVAIVHEKAKADYDPDRICKAQTHVTYEQCRSQIDFAMSAGW